jgi:predicted phage-related endonuclease
MNFLKRMLRLAREHEPWSNEARGFESSALTSIKAMVSFWADEYTLDGRKLKGQDLVRWKKEVYARIQELDEIFKEDEKLRKEVKK